MTALPSWSPPAATWVDKNGRLTVEAQRWLRDLWFRVGGANAPSNADIAITEYADSGIEESKAEMFRIRGNLETEINRIEELRAILYEQAKRIDALEQGLSL